MCSSSVSQFFFLMNVLCIQMICLLEHEDDFGYNVMGIPERFNRRVTEFLNENYEGRWTGRNGLLAWSSRSPDLKTLYLRSTLSWDLTREMGPICAETSVRNYRCMLRKITEERRSHLHRGGCPRSSIVFLWIVWSRGCSSVVNAKGVISR